MMLQLRNVYSLGPLGAFYDVEFHFLSFIESLESLHVQAGIMNKNVFSAFVADKAVPLLIVKPLHSSLLHVNTSKISRHIPLFQASYTLAQRNLKVKGTGAEIINKNNNALKYI